MALQIKKGTNAQRSEYTPLVGELLYVTDHVQAGVDPIYVGDGTTLGGVAVGQNAVLSGNLEGDINLFGNDILGTGDINHTGTITTKKVTITGNTEIVGGDSVVVAISSTGRISHNGNINVDGNIISTGAVQAVSVESDLTGSVISSDSTQILVDSTTNQFNGSKILLSDTVANSSLLVGGSYAEFNAPDIFTTYRLGSEAAPTSIKKYEVRADERIARILPDLQIGAGITKIVTYRGTEAAPENIQQHDRLGGFIFNSYNNKVGSDPAIIGFAGAFAFVAEDQTDAPEGVVPTTFIIGTGEEAAALTNDPVDPLDPVYAEDNTTGLLKFTSKGVLKVKALQLNQLTRAERNDLSSNLASGSLVFVTDPAEGGDPRLQIKIGTSWFNVTVTPTT
jgi:hypothetical protein